MTFEEFFKKKKISLSLLKDAEPGLVAEFEHHFAQMGEKSFDHTKKYWFNQLRHRFPLPPEVKVEKLVIENKLAEQTIADALTEPAETPAPPVGFKPRFKAAAPKPEEAPAETQTSPTEEKQADATPAPAVGFKPRFKAAMIPKPADQAEEKPAEQPATDRTPAEEAPKPAVGFKPRFKAAMVAKPAEEKTEDKPAEDVTASTPATEEAPKPAVGFKPRFKAALVSKPVEEQPAPPVEKREEPAAEQPGETPADTASKPVGFKPRFNAAKMKPKDPGTE